MSTKYLESIQEVKSWLSFKNLDEFIYLLLDNAYDDLEAISAAGEAEMKDLEGLFQTPDSKRSIRLLVESLQKVGIDTYRKADKSGVTDFKTILAASDATTPAAAAVAVPVKVAAPVAPAPKVAVSAFARPGTPSLASPTSATATTRRPTTSATSASLTTSTAASTPVAAAAAPAVPSSPVPTLPATAPPAVPAVSQADKDKKAAEEKAKKDKDAADEAAKKKAEDDKKKAAVPVAPAAPAVPAKAAATPAAAAATTPAKTTPTTPAATPAKTATTPSAATTAAAAKKVTSPGLSPATPTVAPSPAPGARTINGKEPPSTIPGRTGYLCVRTGAGEYKVLEHKDIKWTDKYVLLEPPNVRWLTNRKENLTDSTFSLAACSQVKYIDSQTVRMQFANNWAEIWSNGSDINDWMTSLERAHADVRPVVKPAKKTLPSTSSNDEDQGSEVASTPPSPSPSPLLKPGSLLSTSPGTPQGTASALRGGDSDIDEFSSSPPGGDSALGSPTTPRVTISGKREEKKNGTKTIREGKQEDDSDDDTKAAADDSDDDLDDEKSRGDWDHVVKSHAAKTARMSLALPERGSATGASAMSPSSAGSAAAAVSPKVETASEKRFKQFSSTLLNGANFKKYKRGNMSKRLIWVTPNFDFLCWGDEEKNTVKGFMLTSTLEEINQGFGRNITKIYVVSSGRTLELEAKTADIAKEWVGAIEFLIQFTKVQEEKKKALVTKPGYKDKLEELKAESTKLLLEGDTFKKWPGRKKIQKGAFTVRRIWADPIDSLNWGEAASTKVKGSILLQDMVQVLEDDNDKLKFTIFSKARSLDLEAKSAWVRDKWVKALRFWIEYNKTQPRAAASRSAASKDDD